MADGGISSGYAIPDAPASKSASAPIIRAAAISSDASAYLLPVLPRRIVDQNHLECCVSCALGAGMEVMNASWPALAPLFHYYVTRYEQAGADENGFLYLSNALQTLATIGICESALHNVPFTPAGTTTKPSPSAYADAKSRALARRGLRNRYAPCAYSSVVAWAREQLKRNCPVVIGLRLPMGYPGLFLNDRFEWLDPTVAKSDSGHCVLAVGYSDVRQALRIVDSRGAEVFDRGRWWMGYRVADSEFVREAYNLQP